ARTVRGHRRHELSRSRSYAVDQELVERARQEHGDLEVHEGPAEPLSPDDAVLGSLGEEMEERYLPGRADPRLDRRSLLDDRPEDVRVRGRERVTEILGHPPSSLRHLRSRAGRRGARTSPGASPCGAGT